MFDFELVYSAPPFCTRKSPHFPKGKWTSFPEGSSDPVVMSVFADRVIGRMGIPNFFPLIPVCLFHRSPTATGRQLDLPGTLSGEGGLSYETGGSVDDYEVQCPPLPREGSGGG